jgi:hypothetical protein
LEKQIKIKDDRIALLEKRLQSASSKNLTQVLKKVKSTKQLLKSNKEIEESRMSVGMPKNRSNHF